MPSNNNHPARIPLHPASIKKRNTDSATYLNDFYPSPRPSDILKQFSLSTSERLAQTLPRNVNIYEKCSNKSLASPNSGIFSVPDGMPLFHVSPPQIILQNVNQNSTYEVALYFRNNDKYPRRLRLEPIEDSRFMLKGWKSDSLSTSRIAPGMDAYFTLKFTPDQDVDIATHIVCETEREKFIIPVYVIGPRAVFDFPDEILFGEVPVKHTTTKSILVRNVGNKDGSFHVQYPIEGNSWKFEPEIAFVPKGSSVIIDVNFHPTNVTEYSSFARVLYNSQASNHDEFEVVGKLIPHLQTIQDDELEIQQISIKLLGSADNVDVRLSQSSLTLDPTYITMSSNATVIIYNESSIVATYSWKKCATPAADSQFRSRQKLIMKPETTKSWPDNDTLISSDSFQSIDGSTSSAANFVIHNKTRAIDEDPLLYIDPILQVEPKTGTVWPYSSVKINITFKPVTTGIHLDSMFCEISGRESRLPLTICGNAIGPKLQFSYDLLNIRDVFVNSNHVYTVQMENTGLVAASFELLDIPHSSHIRKCFTFEPSSGIVAVGQSIQIRITFQPQVLGNFQETFSFHVLGATQPLQIQTRGTVLGPTFEFDLTLLDLGTTSYGFPAVQTFRIINTCEIDFEYSLIFENTINMGPHEIEFFPQCATVLAQSCIVVSVQFVGHVVADFLGEIHVDITQVGSSLRTLPLRAIVNTPKLSLSLKQIDFGEAYLGKSVDVPLQIINSTLLNCRYVISNYMIDPKVGTLSIDYPQDELLSEKSCIVNFKFTPTTLGKWNHQVHFAVDGRMEEVDTLVLTCNCKGPDCSISAGSVINFGKVPVLAVNRKKIELRNSSIIDGHFRCIWRDPGDGVFSVEPTQGVVQGHDAVILSVNAYLNDTMVFKNCLDIFVDHGPHFTVNISARGIGVTIEFPSELQNVDFGAVFSASHCSRKFVLTNKGRRTMNLAWQPNEQIWGARNSNVFRNCVFQITPQRFTLKPGASQTIAVAGTSIKSKMVLEKFMCQISTEGDSSGRELINTIIRAQVIDPLIIIEPPVIEMDISHADEFAPKDMTKSVQIKNSTQLNITAIFKCPPPWSLPLTELTLEGYESKTLDIILQSAYFSNRQSQSLREILEVQCDKHPQKTYWDLTASVAFPNLELSTSYLDLGCISIHTCAVGQISISNPGTIPTKFRWKLLEATNPFIDVCPLYGVLAPGEVLQINIALQGVTDGPHNALLALDAEGGPTYELKVICLVADTRCEVSTTNISIFVPSHLQMSDTDLVLINRGRYPTCYRVIFPHDCPLYQSMLIMNTQGSLSGRTREKLPIKILPLVPGIIFGYFFVQFNDLRPIKVNVKIESVLLYLSVEAKEYRIHDPKKLASRVILPKKRWPNSLGSAFISALLCQIQSRQSKRRDNKLTSQKDTLLDSIKSIPIRTYLIDYEEVILNNTIVRQVTLTNPLQIPISFSVDTQALKGNVFSVLWDKNKPLRLGPNESTILPITLNTQHCEMDQCVNVMLPLRIVDGAIVHIQLRACISDPDLNFKPPELYFDPVMCSQRATKSIHFTNVKGVSCKWRCTSKKRSKETDVWKMVPESGVLMPEESSKILIHFTPTVPKLYKHIFEIDMEGATAPTFIQVQGSGMSLKLTFEPDIPTFPSIQPYGDGSETKITIRNPNSVPLEVFSLDYDEDFGRETLLLNELSQSYPHEIFFVPRPAPGEPLQLSSLNPSMRSTNTSESNAEYKVVLKPNDRLCNISVILHGPPFCGSDDLLNRLNKMSNIFVMKLDVIFDKIVASLPELPISNKLKDLSQAIKTMNSPSVTSHANPLSNNNADGITDVEESELSEKDVEMAIQAYLTIEPVPQGHCIVFNGLESRYSKFHETHLRGIVSFLLGFRCSNIFFAHLKVEPAIIYTRELEKIQNDYKKALAGLPSIHYMNDDEYDELSGAEQADFDHSLTSIRKLRTEFFQAIDLENRQHEQEVIMRISGKKSEDERLRRKDKKRKQVVPGTQPNSPSIHTSSVPSGSAPSQPQLIVVGPNTPIGCISHASVTGAPNASQSGSGVYSSTEKTTNSLSSRDFKNIVHTPFPISQRPMSGINQEQIQPTNAPPELLLRSVTHKMYETYVSHMDIVIQTAKDLERSAAKMNVSASVSAITNATGNVSPEKKKKAGQSNFTAQPPGASVTPLNTGPISFSSLAIESEFSAVRSEMQLTGDDSYKITILELETVESTHTFASLLESVLCEAPNDFQANGMDDDEVIEQVIDPQFWISHANPAQKTSRIFSLITDVNDAPDIKEQMKELVQTKKEKRAPEKPKEEYDESRKHSYRWVIAAGESKVVGIKFNTTTIGKYTAHLKFGITGYLVQPFLVMCHGISQYPNIITDPRKVFNKIHTTTDRDIAGCFVLETNSFEFGPLPLTRQRSDKDRYSENKATFTLINPTSQDVKLSILLVNDKSDTFVLDSSALDIKSYSTHSLSAYCWPRSIGRVEDTLVICVKDNPDPFQFKLAGVGYKPEIELDRRNIAFEKIIIGKSDTRDLRVRNQCCVPLNVRLVGLEGIGEEVIISPLEVGVQPLQEEIFKVEFKSARPCTYKRNIKLEFIDQMSGTVGTENFTITAEAYDVAVDVILPKGVLDTLDFGTVRVLEESRAVISFRNRGRYEVSFKVNCERSEFTEYLAITPSTGIVAPSEKTIPLNVVFSSRLPVAFRDQLMLRCQIFDPTSNQIMYSIPIKINARSVLSNWSIIPMYELPFGALVHGMKTSRSFTIENTGEFEFRFTIVKIHASTALSNAVFDNSTQQPKLITNSIKNKEPHALQTSPTGSFRRLSAASNSLLAPIPPVQKSIANKKEVNKQNELSGTFGQFVCTPTNGMIQAGSRVTVVVDFLPDQAGVFAETIGIDISDSTVEEVPAPIEYRLTGESCIPCINTNDPINMFEEQTICKRLDSLLMDKVYAEDERTLYFGTLIVGQESSTRVRLSNPSKVMADVSVFIRSRTKVKEDIPFCVEPSSISIPSHESRYITIQFRPVGIHSFYATFEAIVDNSPLDVSARTFSFDLKGEGSLPRITIDKQVLRFKPLLLTQTCLEKVILRNDGVLPARVSIEWVGLETQISCPVIDKHLEILPKSSFSLPILYNPTNIGRAEAEIRCRVIDNFFESPSVQLVGVCYQENIWFSGLDDILESDDKVFSMVQRLSFKKCHINQIENRVVQVSNHSDSWMKLVWSSIPQGLLISPSAYFLAPGNRRSMNISFQTQTPLTLKQQPMVCIFVPIKKPGNEWAVGEGPEPNTEVTDKEQERLIHVNAEADWSTYTCACTSIHFKRTMMYQSRIYQFQIQNTGSVHLNFRFLEYDTDFILVEPNNGSVPANELVNISVKFTPLDEGVFEETLLIKFENISPQGKVSAEHAISITGSSLRPICHIDLPNPECAPDAETHCIDFVSTGICQRNFKKFFILNPTERDWRYEWKPVCPTDTTPFSCSSISGVVMHGKRSEICFEYYPRLTGTSESAWLFCIEQHNIHLPFMLTGRAIEPNVFLDKSTVIFKPALIGKKSKETIRIYNTEDTPFSFQIHPQIQDKQHKKDIANKESEDQTNISSLIDYMPSSGIIEAKSQKEIKITFQPKAEQQYIIQMLCTVKRKSVPLYFNVSGEGYRINANLTSTTRDGSYVYYEPQIKKNGVKSLSRKAQFSQNATSPNSIEMGRVQVGERRNKTLNLRNTGRYLIEYNWMCSDSRITIEPKVGTLMAGNQAECVISFSSSTAARKMWVPITCTVSNGPTFMLSLFVEATLPNLLISPPLLDFGPKFMYKKDALNLPDSSVQTITLKNNDLVPLSLDVTTSNPSIFKLSGTTIKTLSPSESMHIQVTFIPTEAIEYNESLAIEINGVSKLKAVMTASGCEFCVQLLNSEDWQVIFGSLRPGVSSCRSIQIVNRSKIASELVFESASSADSLERYGLSFAPKGFVLQPKQIKTIDFQFQPLRRVIPFTEEFYVKCSGIRTPLCVVSGTALGMDVRLETGTVIFGPVAVGSLTSKRLNICNYGDIGASFKWNKVALSPDFDIIPNKGYLPPGMELPLDIVFRPFSINANIRKDNIECRVEDVDEPMMLNLSGICIPPPAHVDHLKFNVPVRCEETKSIVLTNKSNVRWDIQPVIDNISWTGAKAITVHTGSTFSYDLIFKPMQMNVEYIGSIFFPLPDGSGLLYKMTGVADKPLPIATINREIIGKKNHVESLTVHNWLNRSQRFRVHIEQVPKPELFVLLEGHNYVDLPGLGTREYKLHFYSFKETTAQINVTFINETSNEYLYYEVFFKVNQPGLIDSISIQSTVRQIVHKTVHLVNPLPVATTFTGQCTLSDIHIANPTYTLGPKTECDYHLEYIPLVPQELTIGKLIITSVELGAFVYEVKTSASNPTHERTTHFKAMLGHQHTQTVRFVHFCRSKTEFGCKIEHPDFTCDKTITVQPLLAAPSISQINSWGIYGGTSPVSSPLGIVPNASTSSTNRNNGTNYINNGGGSSGQQVQLDVVYEPSKLGEVDAVLHISSPTGGDYKFPLHGIGMIPQPQGPITIKSGPVATTIPFKNILNVQATFSLCVDNSSFVVKPSDTLGPKKSGVIGVIYRGHNDKDVGGSITLSKEKTESGRLVVTEKQPSTQVTTVSSPGLSKVGKLTVTHSPSGVSWVYYLKGTQS